MARLSLAFHKKFRPFKALKKIMPATLLARALVILIAPLVFVQIIMAVVFWDRHWSKTTETLAEGIAGNIATFIWVNEGIAPAEAALLNRSMATLQSLRVTLHPKSRGFSRNVIQKPDWRSQFLNAAIKKKIRYPFRVRVFRHVIKVEVLAATQLFEFEINKYLLLPKTIPIVLWWEIGAPLFFILIAIIFMRNQVRPLQTLAEVVGNFGKGRDVSEYKPSGALEVRRVGRAFNAMRSSIQRQISQRTEMLAGISHDLKTPLTRMQLQLAMLPEQEARTSLLEDVKEMEKLVGEYLAFARGEEFEQTRQLNFKNFLDDIIRKLPSDKVHYQSDVKTEIPFIARPSSLQRAFKNIINNALRYGKELWLSVSVSPRTLTIIFEDNGPGVPADRREDVLRPFVRLDESRNLETGGFGLGLSIAQDIVTSHGGSIFLQDSLKYGGLRVVINLPR
jgi:Signal transduction histidine kinase